MRTEMNRSARSIRSIGRRDLAQMMANQVSTIVVDGLSALQGGGQTYLINLFRYLPERFRDSLRVIAVIPESGDVFKVNDQIEYVQSSFASGGLVRRMIWSKLRLPRAASTDQGAGSVLPRRFRLHVRRRMEDGRCLQEHAALQRRGTQPLPLRLHPAPGWRSSGTSSRDRSGRPTWSSSYPSSPSRLSISSWARGPERRSSSPTASTIDSGSRAG